MEFVYSHYKKNLLALWLAINFILINSIFIYKIYSFMIFPPIHRKYLEEYTNHYEVTSGEE